MQNKFDLKNRKQSIEITNFLVKEVASKAFESWGELADYTNSKFGVRLTGEQVRCRCKRNGITITSAQLMNIEVPSKLKSLYNKPSNYIIVSASYGAKIHEKFAQNIKTFAKVNKAQILLIPSRIYALDERKFSESVEKFIKDNKVTILTEGVRLNSNLSISSFEISSIQIKPLTGIDRWTKRYGSTIFASPKQHLEVLPVKTGYPRLVVTTGSITKPNYKEHIRTGRIAKEDHVSGFIFARIKNSEIFNIRPIRATQSGSFGDYDKYYSKGRVVRDVDIVQVNGDLHVRHMNIDAVEETIKQANDMRSRTMYYHDTFDGDSVNPWEASDMIAKTLKLRESNAEIGTIANEIDEYIEAIATIVNKTPHTKKHIIVHSNHDERLDAYIKHCKWTQDTVNFPFCCELFTLLYKENLKTSSPKSSLELAVRSRIPSKYKEAFRKVVFLKKGESSVVRGVECGEHGHKGINGAKGTQQRNSKTGPFIKGHFHVPMMHNDAYYVGTLSDLRLSYNKEGYSSWLHCNIVIHRDGIPQLLIFL